jgi:hypothetical protein
MWWGMKEESVCIKDASYLMDKDNVATFQGFTLPPPSGSE